MPEPRKLKNLKINAVALVDSPANKSPFFLFKRDNAAGEEKAKLEGQIASLNDELIKKNGEITKKDGEITALKDANTKLMAENAEFKEEIEKSNTECENAIKAMTELKDKIITEAQIQKMVDESLAKNRR